MIYGVPRTWLGELCRILPKREASFAWFKPEGAHDSPRILFPVGEVGVENPAWFLLGSIRAVSLSLSPIRSTWPPSAGPMWAPHLHQGCLPCGLQEDILEV